MQWHIITSSKGGVGKTLLTLLLSARNLELGTTTLVIDLNAMNADSGTLLVGGAPKIQTPITLPHLKAAEETEQFGAENIIVQRVYSFCKKKEGVIEVPYAVGWPSNPFNLYRPSLFADFLYTIKESLPAIKEKLGLEIQSVIIDTNYHFCNIFSQLEDHYKLYKEELKKENITCWFLWVYRQLENLLEGNIGADKVYMSARLMEKHFKHDDNSIPIMHVITPVSLVSSEILSKALSQPQESGEKGNENAVVVWLKNTVFKKPEEKANAQVMIENLDKVALTSKGNYKNFADWIDILEKTRRKLKVFGDEREQEGAIFLRTLLKALGNERPMNVIPLWNYHPELQRYTDKRSDDHLAYLMSLEIYNSLKKLLV